VPLLTAGHGTADRSTLLDLFRSAGVGQVVDVRRFPGSRRNPDVARDAMADWLPAAGIGYRWDPRLGGRRHIPVAEDDGADGWWRVTAFRAYAAHTRTPDFADGVSSLLADVDDAEPRATLVLCSESLWWRCHRRLISDAVVLLHHRSVDHLAHDGRLTRHTPAEGARVAADGLHYDVGPEAGDAVDAGGSDG
jgi:uncharacterized protein (DUF488 family)